MMKRSIRTWALAGTAWLASANGGLAAERTAINKRTGLYELPVTDLRKAAERGDRVDLARVAARLGPARLSKALQDPDRRTVLAALDGLPFLSAGIQLLEGVAPLLSSPDESIRAHAAVAAAALFAANNAVGLSDWEIAVETTQTACQALAVMAANETEALPTRLVAVQGLADAPAACAPSRKPEDLLASGAAEIRRAAVVALVTNASPTNVLVAAAQDREASVAAAAGAKLCERRTKDKPLPPGVSLRKLALADGALPEDVVGMVPCLASSADPADAKALEELKKSSPAAVRDAVVRLNDKGP